MAEGASQAYYRVLKPNHIDIKVDMLSPLVLN